MKYFIAVLALPLFFTACKKDPAIKNQPVSKTSLAFVKELTFINIAPAMMASNGSFFYIINTHENHHASNSVFTHAWYDGNFSEGCSVDEELFYGGAANGVCESNGNIFQLKSDNFHTAIIKVDQCNISGKYIFYRQDTAVPAGNTFFKISQKGHLVFNYRDSIFCMDTSGNMNWKKPLAGLNLTAYRDVCETSGGEILLLGEMQNVNTGRDFCVTRFDVNGNTAWQKLYGGIYYDEAQQFLYENDSRIFLLGHSNSWTNNMMHDALIVKINANGDSLQYKTFGGPNHEGLQGGKFYKDKLVVTGYRDPDGTNKEMVFVTLLDKDLNVLSQTDAPFTENHRTNSCGIVNNTFAVCGGKFTCWFSLPD
jgi:hypothetical protein